MPLPLRPANPSVRGLRSGLRTPGLALAVVLLSAGLTPAGAQAELRLDPDSLRLQDGRLSFQFEWPSGGVADFEVQTADSLPVPPALPGWSAGGEATLEGITDGVFRVAVPLGPGGERYIRVRSRVLPPAGPAPVINEVMADNDTAHAAGPGRYWDWIELFNPHDEAVDLQGYTLGPAGAAAGPAFPATRLQPGGYLLVYATDSAEPPPAGTRVIAPGLPSGGGPLVLRDRFGREVERFDVPPLAPDQSVGRVPDGADTWQLFAREAATPGRTNGPAGSAAVIEAPRFFPEGG
ncbi:MAG: lamin tail domain-containing protein, partial [Verrucomicrobiota bacterium]